MVRFSAPFFFFQLFPSQFFKSAKWVSNPPFSTFIKCVKLLSNCIFQHSLNVYNFCLLFLSFFLLFKWSAFPDHIFSTYFLLCELVYHISFSKTSFSCLLMNLKKNTCAKVPFCVIFVFCVVFVSFLCFFVLFCVVFLISFFSYLFKLFFGNYFHCLSR